MPVESGDPHMSHRPQNVAELLIESKDLSELMVDLAYAAITFGDDKLAGELRRLRKTLGGYLHDLRLECILEARSPEDARLMSGVVLFAEAIDDIGRAASDIARIVTANLGIPQDLLVDLASAEETIGRIRVREGAALAGRSLGEVHLPRQTGVWVIALRRGPEWQLDPQADTVVAERDVLLVRGSGEGITKAHELAGNAPPRAETTPAGPALSDLDRAIDLLVEMKNAAEAAIRLAYSAVALGDLSLAVQVAAMESESNRIRDELESWVLHAAADPRRAPDLRGLLRLAAISEVIFNAARKLSSLALEGEGLHPIVQLALEDTEEVAVEATIFAGSPAEGQTVDQLIGVTGISILAIQRGERWIYRPNRSFPLQALDRLVAIGSTEGIAALSSLAWFEA